MATVLAATKLIFYTNLNTDTLRLMTFAVLLPAMRDCPVPAFALCHAQTT